jgi:hypothetical protein
MVCYSIFNRLHLLELSASFLSTTESKFIEAMIIMTATAAITMHGSVQSNKRLQAANEVA